ncbi:MAG: hypothetical protein IH862_09365 [Chloroflexi bacterium]|nr:hypothetical protein [Chloroflexota bacterium]
MRIVFSWIQRLVDSRRARHEFEDVLNECLERLAAGDDVGRCASSYPEHEEELLPLLTMAAAMQAASTPPNTAEAKARGFVRFSKANADRRARKRRGVPELLRPMAKPLIVAFAVVAVTAVAAGGTTVASSNSVPGEPLYWVKTTKESILLRIIPRSDISTAKVHARLAEERGKEMGRLIEMGRIGAAEDLAVRMRRHLNASANFVGVVVPEHRGEMRPPRIRNARELGSSLERGGARLRAALSRLMQDVPPEHRSRVQRVMRQSELRYRMLIEALYAGDAPERTPFGRIEHLGRQGD